jgi:CDP-paratose 2-epimerase
LKYIGFDGQGHQVRDCLHPRDLARLVALQLHAGDAADKPRLANVSGGVASACSLQQLSRWCSERWGMQAVASSPEPRPYDLPWVVLDHQRCSQAWDWSPQISLEAVLEEIANFAQANPDWIALSA